MVKIASPTCKTKYKDNMLLKFLTPSWANRKIGILWCIGIYLQPFNKNIKRNSFQILHDAMRQKSFWRIRSTGINCFYSVSNKINGFYCKSYRTLVYKILQGDIKHVLRLVYFFSTTFRFRAHAFKNNIGNKRMTTTTWCH